MGPTSSPSPFFRLPPELREIIYTHVYASPNTIVVIPNPRVTYNKAFNRAPGTRPRSMEASTALVLRPSPDLQNSRNRMAQRLTLLLEIPVHLPPPLHLVCRTCHDEAIPHLYQALTFGFWDFAGLHRFLQALAPAAAASVRRVAVETIFRLPTSFAPADRPAATAFHDRCGQWHTLWIRAFQALTGLQALSLHVRLRGPDVLMDGAAQVSRPISDAMLEA